MSDFFPSNSNSENADKIEFQLQEIIKTLRPGQVDLAYWKNGEMAISAVPGAGKSYSLSVAASIVIAKNKLDLQKQLIIVTYTRSAASSIKKKTQEQLTKLGLSSAGFQVQTLHGLALNIANSHPDVSELNLSTSTLIVPRPSHRIIRNCVEEWIAINPLPYQKLIEGNHFDGEETEKLRRQSALRTEILPKLAYTIIREAKSSGLSPSDVEKLSHYSDDYYQVLAIASGLYEQYERLMRENNFIDYDDMILAALRVLENATVRQRWQNQVFAVFEDEAQDSSPLQGKLINILANNHNNPHSKPNLIRVGDPNQAINSTFTPADPVYFNLFCDRMQQSDRLYTMNKAGRSSKKIIEVANFTLKWVNEQEQKLKVKKQANSAVNPQLPFRYQEINIVSKNDPQPDANPQAEGNGVEIHTPEDIYHTVELIGDRLKDLLSKDKERNAAILVRENSQAKFLAENLTDTLKNHNIPLKLVSEFENYSPIPEEILKLLQFVERPHSPYILKIALEVLQERQLIASQDLNVLSIYPEKFLYPTILEPPQKPHVSQAKKYLCDLLQARLELPHYQLIPFIGLTLNYSSAELATIEKLSERINQEIIGKSSLKSTIQALKDLVNSERFEGIEEDNQDQYTRKGQVTIMTMHKAKGLDWDYVFLPFLHENVLPGKPYIPSSAKFLGNFNLAEVARGQLRFAIHNEYLGKTIIKLPSPMEAYEEVNKLKKAEEYRLLYVAITRAKRLLWMSASKFSPFKWSFFKGNKGAKLSQEKPCPILLEL